MKIQGFILSLVLTASGAAFAQNNSPATPILDQKQAHQQQRINQGVATGQLNKREAARLQARQKRLAAHKRAARADGVVTKKERVLLNQEADRNNRSILRQKHDSQTARP